MKLIVRKNLGTMKTKTSTYDENKIAQDSCFDGYYRSRRQWMAFEKPNISKQANIPLEKKDSSTLYISCKVIYFELNPIKLTTHSNKDFRREIFLELRILTHHMELEKKGGKIFLIKNSTKKVK